MKSWRTHDCERKKEKEKPPAEAGRKGITILPSILEYVDPNMWFHLQHYKNLNQVFNNPNSQSFSLFFFFLRGVRIETTQPLRTAVALLHEIHIWILR